MTTILLIEGNPDDALLVQRAIRKANLPHPVQVVEDGQAAIDYLQAALHQASTGAGTGAVTAPRLVLLDLALPRKTGFEVLEWMRQQPELRALPVVILTSSRDIPTIERAFDAGANAYLVKPPAPEALRELVTSLAAEFERPPRILLIDDSPDDRALALRELRRAWPAVQATEIASAEALAAALDSGGFDLVVSDVSMPWATGLGNLRAVKARWPECPVIILTGTGSEQIAEALHAGLDDYVLKKHIARLPLAVRAALGRARQRVALRESEERFRRLSEATVEGVAIHDRGVILDANEALARMFGYELAEVIGKNALELAAPESRDLVLQNIRAGHEQPYEAVGLRKDGATFAGELIGRAIPYEGRTVRVTAIRDITARKQVEKALQESEQRYRSIVENVNQAYYEADRRSIFTYCNPGLLAISGYTAEELRGKASFRLVAAEDRERVMATYREWLQEKRKDMSLEFRAVTKGGRKFWVEQVTHFEFGPDGRFVKASNILRDIDERKQAEESLRRSEERYRTLAEAAHDYIFVVNRDGVVEYVNEFAASEFARRPKEIIGQKMEALFPPEISQRQRESLQRVFQIAEPYYAEDKSVFPRGEVWLGTWLSPLFDETGQVRAVLGISRDITDRKRAAAAAARRLAELEAVNRISTALRVAQTLDEMLPRLLDETLAVLGAEAGLLFLYDAGRDEVRKAAARGYFARLPETPLPAGEGLTALILQTGEPIVSREYAADPRLRVSVRALTPPGWGGAGVPIRAAQAIVGFFFISVQLPREVTAQEARLLTTLAEIAGNAIHRARLHEQTERQVERLAALHTIDAAISGSLDLRVTLDVLVSQTITQLGVDAADVLLLNPHLLTLEYAAGRGFRSKAIERSRVRLGEGHAGRAALERRTVLVPDLPATSDEFVRAPQLIGESFVAYFAVPLIAKGQVRGVLEVFHRAPLAPGADWLDFLETLAGQAAIAIDNAQLFDGLQRSNVELTLAYDATIEGWSRALDLRDRETEGHTQRVTEMTLRLAEAMGLTRDELVHVRRGALLHDIGKMGVPDSILLKPDTLTDDEWRVMRLHPRLAYDMLWPINYLRPALDIPYCHHEKWDGSGYPRGLKGEQIPLAARIFAVADVWDALRSNRPYREAWPEEKVREHIRAGAGTHFDPAVVEVFSRLAERESQMAE